MSFPRYPHYKASGVEWLGEIPEHWEICRLGTICSKIGSGKTPSGGAENYETSGILFIRSQNVHDHGLMLDDAAYISDTIDSELSSSRVKRNDILLNITGASIGRTCIVSTEIGNANVNQHVCIIRMKNTENAFFVSLSLKSSNSQEQIAAMQTGAARDGLNYSQISRILTAFPPHDEQKNIITFLVQETAKIDALVVEQQRLIELLKEKRQAVISHAVTKGLDPHAPMKPSGIEWLGEVPEHWTMSALKWLTQPDRPIMYGIVLPGPDVGDGVPILKGGNVKPSRMNLESMARTTPEIEEKFARARLREGDLVYAIRGTIGDCEKVPQEMEGSNITQDVARVAIDETNCATWARWALLASAIQEDLACGSLGAAVRGINIFDLKRVKIPTPPPAEQREISAFLDRETLKLEELTAEAQRAIDLLQERRTALISAAVTGQIDVRQLAQGVAA